MSKVLLSIAHSKQGPGVSLPSGVSEYAMSCEQSVVVLEILQACGFDVELYDVSTVARKTSAERLGQKIRKVNQGNYALAIELHHNSGPPSANHGLVIHAHRSPVGEAVAQSIATELAAVLPWKVSAVSHVDPVLYVEREDGKLVPSDRMGFVEKTKTPAIICEEGFFTNPKAQEWFAKDINVRKAAEAVGRGICRSLRR